MEVSRSIGLVVSITGGVADARRKDMVGWRENETEMENLSTSCSCINTLHNTLSLL